MKTTSIKDIKVPLQVVLGETKCTVEQLAQLTEGSVVELNALAGEPVTLVAAGEPIAKGEVVIIDENFGIRITGILQTEE